jgi:hypothetical protein
MSTYISAGSYYGPMMRNNSTGLVMNSYGTANERNLSGTDTKKNVMLQEVDAELKKLRSQFDSVNISDNTYNKISSNPEEQRTYGYRINGMSSNNTKQLAGGNEKLTVNNSFTANEAPMIAGRINQSFEIRRDVNLNELNNNRHQRTPSGTPQPATYSNILYDPRKNDNSSVLRETPLKMTESNGRVIDASFEVRRLDTKTVDATWQPSRSTEINKTLPYTGINETLNSSQKVEPTRIDVKRMDINTSQPLEYGSRLGQSPTKQMYESDLKANSPLIMDKESTSLNEFARLKKKSEENPQTFQSQMINQE